MIAQFVYALHDPTEDAIKIGCSVAPSYRVKEFEQKLKRPIYLIASIPGNTQRERGIHAKFAPYRIHERGREWFRATPEVWAIVEWMKENEPESQRQYRIERESRRPFIRRPKVSAPA